MLLADALAQNGFSVERQQPVPGFTFVENASMRVFRADLVVEGIVLVELKSVESLAWVHRKQLLTYLKLSA